MDSAQKKIYNTIFSYLNKNKLFNFFSKSKRMKGFYIYGKVGSGKTHTLKEIYNQLAEKKKFFHYQSFVIFIHKHLKAIKKTHRKNNIELLAELLIKRYKYIFIDELEILDITEAMIIKDLIPKITDGGVLVFFSTNIHPDNLYFDGIQRESFMPFIQFIKSNLLITKLENSEDYRDIVSKDNSQQKYYIPNNKKNNEYLLKTFSDLSNDQQIINSHFAINTRKFPCISYSENSIFIDFESVFNGFTSPKDFEVITQKFKNIFIVNIREIHPSENNVIKRFINFIDLAYVEKNIIYMSSKIFIDRIYISGKYKKEFCRTLSRLKEIESFN